MTSEVTKNEKGQSNEEKEEATKSTTHYVDIVVTADIKIVQCDSSPSLNDSEATKHTVSTSLNRDIHGNSTSNLKTKVNEEDNNVKLITAVVSNEIFYQPWVRRSKKHTQLNKPLPLVSHTRTQIDRITILPCLGCTTKQKDKLLKSCKNFVLVKSSKSMGTMAKPEETKELNPYRSQAHFSAATGTKWLGKHSTTKSKKEGDIVAPLLISSNEYPLPNYSHETRPTTRSNFVKCLNSESGSASEEVSKAKYKNNVSFQLNSKSTETVGSHPYKSALERDISKFKDRTFLTLVPKSYTKTTRNVSTMHRPKTTNKATSTTSLSYNTGTTENICKPPRLFLPKSLTGKEFPSEIVLKLVPTKEAFECCLQASPEGDVKINNSSAVDPMAMAPTKICKRRREKGNGFLSCFSKKKKDFDKVEVHK